MQFNYLSKLLDIANLSSERLFASHYSPNIAKHPPIVVAGFLFPGGYLYCFDKQSR